MEALAPSLAYACKIESQEERWKVVEDRLRQLLVTNCDDLGKVQSNVEESLHLLMNQEKCVKGSGNGPQLRRLVAKTWEYLFNKGDTKGVWKVCGEMQDLVDAKETTVSGKLMALEILGVISKATGAAHHLQSYLQDTGRCCLKLASTKSQQTILREAALVALRRAVRGAKEGGQRFHQDIFKVARQLVPMDKKNPAGVRARAADLICAMVEVSPLLIVHQLTPATNVALKNIEDTDPSAQEAIGRLLGCILAAAVRLGAQAPPPKPDAKETKTTGLPLEIAFRAIQGMFLKTSDQGRACLSIAMQALAKGLPQPLISTSLPEFVKSILELLDQPKVFPLGKWHHVRQCVSHALRYGFVAHFSQSMQLSMLVALMEFVNHRMERPKEPLLSTLAGNGAMVCALREIGVLITELQSSMAVQWEGLVEMVGKVIQDVHGTVETRAEAAMIIRNALTVLPQYGAEMFRKCVLELRSTATALEQDPSSKPLACVLQGWGAVLAGACAGGVQNVPEAVTDAVWELGLLLAKPAAEKEGTLEDATIATMMREKVGLNIVAALVSKMKAEWVKSRLTDLWNVLHVAVHRVVLDGMEDAKKRLQEKRMAQFCMGMSTLAGVVQVVNALIVHCRSLWFVEQHATQHTIPSDLMDVDVGPSVQQSVSSVDAESARGRMEYFLEKGLAAVVWVLPFVVKIPPAWHPILWGMVARVLDGWSMWMDGNAGCKAQSTRLLAAATACCVGSDIEVMSDIMDDLVSDDGWMLGPIRLEPASVRLGLRSWSLEGVLNHAVSVYETEPSTVTWCNQYLWQQPGTESVPSWDPRGGVVGHLVSDGLIGAGAPKEMIEGTRSTLLQAVNAAVRCLGLAFTYQDTSTREKLLETLTQVARSGTRARGGLEQHASTHNALTVTGLAMRYASVLQRSERAFGTLSESVLKSLWTLLQRFLMTKNPVLRRCASESLGRLSEVAGDEFTASVVRAVTEQILRTDGSSYARGGFALALGHVHRYCGGLRTRAFVGDSLASLLAASASLESELHCWALHAVWLVGESAGLHFSASVPSVLGLMETVSASDSHHSRAVAVAVGRIVGTIVGVLGPELQPGTPAAKACDRLVQVLWESRYAEGWTEAATITGQLAIMVPQALPPRALLTPRLLNMLTKGHVGAQHAATSCLLFLSQRDADSLKVDNDVWVAHNMCSPRDAEWQDRIGQIVINRVEATGFQHPYRWLDMCRRVALGTTTQKRPSPEEDDEEEGSGSDSDTNAVFEARALFELDNTWCVDGGLDRDGRTLADLAPRETTRALAVECAQQVLEMCCEKDPRHVDMKLAKQQGGSWMVLRLGDWINLAFTTATGAFPKLAVGGIRLLSVILSKFGNVQDPEFEGHGVLEMYSAQIGSAIRASFSPEASLEMTLEGCKAIHTYLSIQYADASTSHRLVKLLTDSLDQLGKEESQEQASRYASAPVAQLTVSVLSTASNVLLLDAAQSVLEPYHIRLRDHLVRLLMDTAVLQSGLPVSVIAQHQTTLFQPKSTGIVQKLVQPFQTASVDALRALAWMATQPTWWKDVEKQQATKNWQLVLSFTQKFLMKSVGARKRPVEQVVNNLEQLVHLLSISSLLCDRDVVPVGGVVEIVQVVQSVLEAWPNNDSIATSASKVIASLCTSLAAREGEYFRSAGWVPAHMESMEQMLVQSLSEVSLGWLVSGKKEAAATALASLPPLLQVQQRTILTVFLPAALSACVEALVCLPLVASTALSALANAAIDQLDHEDDSMPREEYTLWLGKLFSLVSADVAEQLNNKAPFAQGMLALCDLALAGLSVQTSNALESFAQVASGAWDQPEHCTMVLRILEAKARPMVKNPASKATSILLGHLLPDIVVLIAKGKHIADAVRVMLLGKALAKDGSAVMFMLIRALVVPVHAGDREAMMLLQQLGTGAPNEFRDAVAAMPPPSRQKLQVALKTDAQRKAHAAAEEKKKQQAKAARLAARQQKKPSIQLKLFGKG